MVIRKTVDFIVYVLEIFGNDHLFLSSIFHTKQTHKHTQKLLIKWIELKFKFDGFLFHIITWVITM